MPGPPPKVQGARQRRNKPTTHAVLRRPDDEDIEIPKLPKRPGDEWNPLTIRWWIDIWSSPMAPEYDDSDLHGLFMLANLVNDFWNAPNARERQNASAEVRLQSVRFGLSPIDRRRLQWEIEKSEDAQDRGRRRRARQKDSEEREVQVVSPQRMADPRTVLRSV